MKISTILSRVVLCCAALYAGMANAAPITWTMQDVTFDDGATAYGSFVIESTTGDMISWNITTTNGAKLEEFVYDNLSSILYSRDSWGAPYNYLLANDLDGFSPLLNLTFVSALTTPGTVPLALVQSDFGSWECNNCAIRRYITGGSVTAGVAVPEPAPVALMGLGLVLLAARRRKPQ